MATKNDDIWSPLRTAASFSLLPRLEIAVPPQTGPPQPHIVSQYIDRALPPLPIPAKSPKRAIGNPIGSISAGLQSSERLSPSPSTNGQSGQSSSARKAEQSIELVLNIGNRQAAIKKPSDRDFERPDSDSTPTAEAENLSNVRRVLRSDSVSSSSTLSQYSQDDQVEEIVDTYSKGSSWAPVKDNPPLSNKNTPYTRSGIYSVSATELSLSSRIAHVEHSFSSLRHSDPQEQSLVERWSATQTPKEVITLDTLIADERERMRSYTLPRARRESYPSLARTSFHIEVQPEMSTPQSPVLSNGNDYATRLVPQPLALSPKPAQELDRCISRFSDHSSEAPGGVISNARDSVKTHIRNISTPFKSPNRPSTAFKENAATSTIAVPLPMRASKHSLKSPFPFNGPVHKKPHIQDPIQPKGKPSVVRRLSNAFLHFSNSRRDTMIETPIIPNYARTGDGPDMPRPMSAKIMGSTSSTTMFQRGSLQIRAAIQKMKRAVGIRSSEEKRRDDLRNAIVVVGTSDQSPSGMVTRWV